MLESKLYEIHLMTVNIVADLFCKHTQNNLLYTTVVHIKDDKHYIMLQNKPYYYTVATKAHNIHVCFMVAAKN